MPHTELTPPALARPEKSLSQSASGNATPLSASLMPNERQTISGVDVLHESNNLGLNYL